MRTFILPYKLGSNSAKLLAEKLNATIIKGNKKLLGTSCVINWGSLILPKSTLRGRTFILNNPNSILNAKNKLKAFDILSRNNIPTVEYTTDKQTALNWLREEHIVYGRKYIESQEGNGIKILTIDDTYIPDLPLYTKGIIKAHEYRVHVGGNNVIDFSKKKRKDILNSNPFIKNYNNGWVFCRTDVSLPALVKDVSIKAVKALGLSFGAVDVLYKERDNKVYILEINTAPGIEGTTLTSYINYFKGVINEIPSNESNATVRRSYSLPYRMRHSIR